MAAANTRRVPIVGFLTRSLEPNDTYHLKCWKHTCDLAQRKGSHLLMVSGQVLGDPDSEAETMAAVYRLVNPGLVDGAILSQTVLYRTKDGDLDRFDRDLPRVPLVTVTIPLGSRPSVGIDNAVGLRSLIRHLIDDHGCRKIVHVRGPENNQEAADRERVWREELRRSGIEPPPQWLVPGDFDTGLMPTIGRDILDRAGGDIDAVVGCNDMAALRILEDFEALGVKVPEDVIVVGFDDLDSAQLVTPSLTTVIQPIDAQMGEVWSQLERLMRGESLTGLELATTPVFRASCGCPPERWSPGAFPLLDRHVTLRRAVSFYEGQAKTFRWQTYHRNHFFRALNRVSSYEDIAPVLTQWLPRLGFHHFALLRTCTPEGKFEAWESLVLPGAILPTAPRAFRVVVSFPDRGLPVDLVLPSEAFRLSEWEVFRSAGATGIFPLSVNQTWSGLLALQLTAETGLLELNIQEQMASLLERLDREELHRESVANIRAKAAGHEEATKALGRMVAEVAHEINTPLAAILSSGMLLENHLQHRESEFGHLGLKVFETLPHRGGESSATEARQQRARLQALFEALGVQGAAGWADTLTSLGVTASDQDLAALVKDPGWEQALGRVIESRELTTASRIISVAAEKIRDFVERLRQTTRHRVEAEPVVVSADSTLETALMLLGVGRGDTMAIHRRYGDVPPVVCRPNELQQVWINLIRNARQACQDQGNLVLATSLDGPMVRVDIQDDGPGIPREIQDRVFDPFFTTRPEGTGLGLGLDISRRLVEDVGGRIAFTSGPQGTTFSVWLRTLGG